MANEPIITIVGNLTADPELRFTPAGAAVANFTVASTPREKVGDEWQDGEAMFFRCAAWRNLGENVAESLQKGTQVIVQGRLKNRSYEKDGVTRTSLELDVDAVGPSLQFATTKVTRAARGQGGGQPAGQSRPAAAPAADPWARPTNQSADPWAPTTEPAF
jgi:single-strand DNA-binding protein